MGKPQKTAHLPINVINVFSQSALGVMNHSATERYGCRQYAIRGVRINAFERGYSARGHGQIDGSLLNGCLG
jgi:hypothetical protein